MDKALKPIANFERIEESRTKERTVKYPPIPIDFTQHAKVPSEAYRESFEGIFFDELSSQIASELSSWRLSPRKNFFRLRVDGINPMTKEIMLYLPSPPVHEKTIDAISNDMFVMSFTSKDGTLREFVGIVMEKVTTKYDRSEKYTVKIDVSSFNELRFNQPAQLDVSFFFNLNTSIREYEALCYFCTVLKTLETKKIDLKYYLNWTNFTSLSPVLYAISTIVCPRAPVIQKTLDTFSSSSPPSSSSPTSTSTSTSSGFSSLSSVSSVASLEKQNLQQKLREKLFNESQMEAVKEFDRSKGGEFTLILGPPGTGKTKTILGLFSSLLINRKKKLLVCAPSNVAIDEIVRRTTVEGLLGPEGLWIPNFVRIGISRNISEDILQYTDSSIKEQIINRQITSLIFEQQIATIQQTIDSHMRLMEGFLDPVEKRKREVELCGLLSNKMLLDLSRKCAERFERSVPIGYPAKPIDDVRASAWYRGHLVRVFVEEVLNEVRGN